MTPAERQAYDKVYLAVGQARRDGANEEGIDRVRKFLFTMQFPSSSYDVIAERDRFRRLSEDSLDYAAWYERHRWSWGSEEHLAEAVLFAAVAEALTSIAKERNACKPDLVCDCGALGDLRKYHDLDCPVRCDLIYTKVPPFMSVAEVFEMAHRCVHRGGAWGCAV